MLIELLPEIESPWQDLALTTPQHHSSAWHTQAAKSTTPSRVIEAGHIVVSSCKAPCRTPLRRAGNSHFHMLRVQRQPACLWYDSVIAVQCKQGVAVYTGDAQHRCKWFVLSFMFMQPA